MTALIIDDEIQIRRLLRLALEGRGYTVKEAAAGETGLQEVAFHRPNVVLLDLGLPDMDGVEVLKRLRAWSDVPVLILSVRDQETVKVAALESGADDYVTKPFSTAELIARLAVIQRRRATSSEPVFSVGPLTLDLAHQEARLGKDTLHLTPIEFTILRHLAENAGRILTLNQIHRAVWPSQQTVPGPALRVHINHLRQKLAPLIIVQNEPGIGYRLVTGTEQ
jgi:two-component system KDP operon response regulator KdpE